MLFLLFKDAVWAVRLDSESEKAPLSTLLVSRGTESWEVGWWSTIGRVQGSSREKQTA